MLVMHYPEQIGSGESLVVGLGGWDVETDGRTSGAITAAPGLSTGDLLLVYGFASNASSFGPTDSAAWPELFDVENLGAVYGRLADGTGDDTFTAVGAATGFGIVTGYQMVALTCSYTNDPIFSIGATEFSGAATDVFKYCALAEETTGDTYTICASFKFWNPGGDTYNYESAHGQGLTKLSIVDHLNGVDPPTRTYTAGWAVRYNSGTSSALVEEDCGQDPAEGDVSDPNVGGLYGDCAVIKEGP